MSCFILNHAVEVVVHKLNHIASFEFISNLSFHFSHESIHQPFQFHLHLSILEFDFVKSKFDQFK
ncbi:MAG: hypothetical protein Q8S84_07790 [bacterium]|nr:hypothetical protein [bacterium]MDP3381340.1 hypothetical protein [bacterium]